jgi:hypothetical protein
MDLIKSLATSAAGFLERQFANATSAALRSSISRELLLVRSMGDDVSRGSAKSGTLPCFDF